MAKPPSFDKLAKILKLEIDTGYRDRAMIGGLSQYAPKWQEEALRDAESERVNAIADRLRPYSTLSDLDARRQSIDEIVTLLTQAPIPATSSPPSAATSAAPIEEPQPIEPAESPESIGTAPQVEARIEEPAPGAPKPTPPAPPREERRPARDERASTPRPRSGGYTLDSAVTAIPGIGPSNAEKFARLGVKTIRDLLFLLPRRYDDFTALKPINRLQYGDEVTVIGSVWEASLHRTRGGAQIVQAIISDGSGTIQCTWFNPYLKDKIRRGMQIVVSGKVDEFQGRLTFTSPEWEHLEKDLLHTARLVPVYPLTEGLTARWVRRLLKRTVDEWAVRLPDFLPDSVLVSAGLISLPKAIEQAHFPDSQAQLDAARKRLAFDELFVLQIGMLRQRRQWKTQAGQAIEIEPATLDVFLSALPYSLTSAQQRTLDDVLRDIRSGQPMNRLIQGDVGSGKTVVAAAAMFAATQAGAQTAIMAPTEILAEQHFKSLTRLYDGLDASRLKVPVTLRLLTGSTPQAERDEIQAGLSDGRVNILIGTHALIQQGVEFKGLAFIVIDEQHRFGVTQRAALRQKGIRRDEGGRTLAPALRSGASAGVKDEDFIPHPSSLIPSVSPHMLVMTATPIPRTLALTLYGDLDLSVIDEMPPGRQPIETRVVMPSERERMYSFIRAQIEKGRQAYIICPLVEESEKIEAKAAVEEHERLQKQIFPQFRLGLLHGRLKADEKDAVMRAFAANELNILVSTSVVEVGIDVPNATVMLIEGANRFGLSQLHQFRGRVGRGSQKSYCLLLADSTANGASERLQAVEATTDGFVLAEKDLELRGPGEFFGKRQSGLPDMRFSSLADARLIDLARREAGKIVDADPDLAAPEYAALARRVQEFWSSGQGDLS